MVTYETFASGLGLLISSPAVLARLEPGRNYMLYGAVDETIGALLNRQEMVLLGTGSPELDYTIHFHEAAIPPETREQLRDSVTFGLEVSGGAVVIRDGYDLLDWSSDPVSGVLLPVDDAYYRVEVGWVPSPKHSNMILHLAMVRSPDRLAGDGAPDLIYRGT